MKGVITYGKTQEQDTTLRKIKKPMTRRRFTWKEYRRLLKGGKKLGVTYSKEEKRVLKDLTFEKGYVNEEGMVLVKPR